MTPTRVHVLGASGSGTSTLGRALARETGAAFLDTDDFYWLPTDPPFTDKRPVEARLQQLQAELDRLAGWVLSGSLISWGDPLIPLFDLAVFLYVPEPVRIARLMRRERERYGADIDPGGRMHAIHTAFIEWAKGYDVPEFSGRSLARHRAWLAALPCPVVEIAGAPSLEESLERVRQARMQNAGPPARRH